jgi:hypothetical protein
MLQHISVMVYSRIKKNMEAILSNYVHAMKTYERVEVQLRVFLKSVLYESGGQLHSAETSPPSKGPLRGLAGSRHSLEAVEKRNSLNVRESISCS